MKNQSGRAVFAAIVLVMSLLALPASADTAVNSSGLSSGAQKAASLDDLKASDAQLTAAIATLNNEVAAQQASVDSAKQAVDAADQTVQGVQEALQLTQQKLVVLQQAESARAVELYMSPNQDGFISTFMASNGFSDADQREALISVLSGDDYDTLDQLQSAQREFKKEQKEALAAQKTADQRRDDEQNKLNTLSAALADQSKTEQALKQRINSDAAEDATSAQGLNNSDGGRASRGDDNSTDDSRQSSEGLIWPVHGSHTINSPFGMRWGRMHEGIDINASMGQPIYAAKAGTVTFAGQESGYGGYICLQHGGGFQTCYAHETKIEVSVGQQVAQNQEIGTAGISGDATGVNLHFETCSSTGKECFYGQFHNPVDYLP